MRQMQEIRNHRAGSGQPPAVATTTPGQLCQKLADAAGVSTKDVTGFINGTVSLNDAQTKALVSAAGGRKGWQDAISTLGLNLA